MHMRGANLPILVVKAFTGRLPADTQQVVNQLFKLARKFRRHFLIGGGLNILAAFLEVNAMAFITIGLALGMGGQYEEQFRSLGRVGEVLLGVVEGYTPTQALIIMVALAVVTQFLRSTLKFNGTFVTVVLQTLVEADIQKTLFQKYTMMDYAEVQKFSIGELYSTFGFASHVGTVFQTFNASTSLLFNMMFYIVLMFLLSWQLAIGGIIIFLILATAIQVINNQIQVRFQEFVQASIRMSENNSEFLNSIYQLHALNREEFAIRYAKEFIDDAQVAQRKGLFWNFIITPVIEIASIIGISIFVIAGYTLFTPGDGGAVLARLLGFIVIMARLMSIGGSFNSSLAMVYKYWPSVEKVMNMLAVETSFISLEGQPVTGFERGIEFKDVRFQYEAGDHPALDGINLHIPCGKFTAIVGESGSGKSSIIHLLLGMYRPTDGQILIDGADLQQLNIQDWREQIAIVSQSNFIYKMTVKENIRFGQLGLDDDSVYDAAKAAMAHDFIANMPHGYETILGQQGIQISGGERQRLTIARAFARQADILILDEATSALDSRSESKVQDAIWNLMRGKTVIAVAHRLSTIQMADNIIVLKRGQVVEQGTHYELLEQDGEYAQFWKLQARKSEKQGDVV